MYEQRRIRSLSGALCLERISVENRAQRVDRRIPGKRPLPGDHLEQHGTKRKDVRPHVGWLTADLLGRHVARRTDDDARLSGDAREGVGRRHFGHAEVENLHPPISGEKEILRLEIAMHDAGGVRRRETACHLDGVVDNTLACQRWLLLQSTAQRAAFEQLHHQERRTVGGTKGTDVVHGQDIGVIERTRGPRLILEPLLASGVAAKGVWQHLHRDLTPKPGVSRSIHFAHAALTDELDDLVRPKTLAQSQGWRLLKSRETLVGGEQVARAVHGPHFTVEFVDLPSSMAPAVQARTSLPPTAVLITIDGGVGWASPSTAGDTDGDHPGNISDQQHDAKLHGR